MMANPPMKYDPTGNWYENSMAGLGKAFVDPYHRIQQLLGQRSQQQIDEDAELDKPLMNTTGGTLGNIAGQVIQSVPLAGGLGAASKVVPALAKMGTLGRAALQGGLQSAAAPVTSDQTSAGNIAGGALMGAAGQGLVNGANALITPAAKYASPYLQSLAAKADQMGIPVTRAQLTGSKAGQALENFFGGMPMSGKKKLMQTQGDQYVRGVTSTFGPAETDAIKAVGKAKTALGAKFDDISGNNMLALSTDDIAKLDALPKSATDLGGANGTQLQNMVNTIKRVHEENGFLTPGETYQSWRTAIGRNQNSEGAGSAEAEAWRQMQQTLDGAMRRSLGPAEAADWDFLKGQYGNLKDVEKALPVNGQGFTEGTLDPNKLASTMARPTAKNGTNATAMQQGVANNSSLSDVAQVGNAFVPKPNTDVAATGAHGADVLKSLIPALGTSVGAGGVGYMAASHLAPEDSEIAKHPFLTGLGAAAGSNLLGGTVGRFLLSQAYRNGMPKTNAFIDKLSELGIPASLPTAALHAKNASTTGVGPAPAPDTTNPFAGMQEVDPATAFGTPVPSPDTH